MAVYWIPDSVPKIPEVSDEVLRQRYAKMKPVVRREHDPKNPDQKFIGVPFFLPDDLPLWGFAFTWDPKPTERCLEEWQEIARIETYHTCGYIACFKPEIGEVLSQIPDWALDQCDAFETLKGDCVACYRDGDGHRTITILYENLKGK